ncbi:MAG: hypothetical protein HY918_01375 [Candidatus Doudnabacteria bacterium]|nr:hypothetical protein [Candidatus Doudnabacteria bacterium]
MSNKPKQHLFLIGFSTLLTAFSLASIINFTDPQTASFLTFSFFYISLFLMSLGLFTLIGLLIRQQINPGHYIANLSNSFRQALLLSLLITISMVLLSKQLLFWWIELTLILFFSFIEALLNLKI